MPFVRLIMIYAVVIAAVIAFFQRDRITQAFGLSSPPAKVAAQAPAQPQSEPQSEPQPAPTAPAPTEPAPKEPTPSQPAPVQPMAPASAPAAESPAPTAAPQQTQPAAPTRPQPLQTPVAPAPETTNAGPAPTTPAQPKTGYADGETIAAQLDAARQAYWRGDLADAETRYLSLIETAPDTPDALGELGNIYYAQRKYSAAANYYHLAGLALLKEGNRAKVMAIVSALQTIAPAKAADLRGRLAK